MPRVSNSLSICGNSMLFLIEKMGSAKHVVVWCMQIVEGGMSSKLIQEKQKVDKVV